MAKTSNQVDIEDGKADLAIRTIKAFQAGNSTTEAVRNALKGLTAEDLKWVALGTRLSVKSLLDLAA